MRGDTHPAPARGPRLTPTQRNAAAAAAVLLVAVLATGGTSSVLLPLLVAALIVLVRYIPQPVILLAPPTAALLLVLVGLLAGGPADGESAGDAESGARLFPALLVLAATVPGLLWRREARRGLARGAAAESAPLEDAARRPLPPLSQSEELADLARALAAVATRVHARAVVLWEVDGYRGTARARASSGARPQSVVRLSGDPLGWCWEQGMRLRVTQTPRWAEPGTLVVAERLRRADDDGNILTFAFDPGQGVPDDVAFDESAIYLRGVISLQEASTAAASDQRRLALLLNGISQFPGELELESLAPDLCTTAMNVADGTGAVIGFCDGDEGEVIAGAGQDGGPVPGDRFTAPGSELALALRAGSIIVREADTWSIGRTCVATPDERWQRRPRALAVLPLRGAGGIVGVLAVWSSRAGTLDPHGLDLLRVLSPYAALHLEHARTYGRLRETAERDPLTQLRNRRSFEQVFAAETSRFDRYGHPLSLLMLDLDHFKSINDQYGHEAGDEVLRQVARVIGSCIRDVDTAARLGGEEFVVLLPETPIAAALEVASRIRAAIAAQPVGWGGRSIPVRVSVGVSACPERVDAPSDLVGSADAALYRAKEAGRDRVVAAERGG